MIELLDNKRVLTNHDILKLAYVIIGNANLNAYCEPEIIKGRNYFAYSGYERKLKLPEQKDMNSNYLQDQIIYKMETNEIKNILFEEKNNTDKILILYAILHEVEHANQQKKIAEDYKKYNPKYVENLISSIFNRHSELSLRHHNIAYHEYDANINAILKVIEFNKTQPLENIEAFNQFAAFLILKASTNFAEKYECPLSQNDKITQSKKVYTVEAFRERYNKKYKDDLVDFAELFGEAHEFVTKECNAKTLKKDLMSRLLNGDNLTLKEREKLSDIANGVVRTEDLYNELKLLNEKVKSPFTAPSFKEASIRELFGRKR